MRYFIGLFRYLMKENFKNNVEISKKIKLNNSKYESSESDKIINTSLTVFGISMITTYSGYLSYKLFNLVGKVRENKNFPKKNK